METIDPSEDPTSPAGAAPPSPWRRLGRGAIAVGLTLADLARAARRSAEDAVGIIDPQARRHLAEGALLGSLYAVPGWGAGLWEGVDGQRPTLFVHGLGGSPRNFGPLRAFLRITGHGPSDAVAFEDHTSLEVMARQLQWKILELAERAAPGAGRSIDVVAHSMGGIVTRLALADPSVAKRVNHLITLGTPHSGTGLARFLATPKVLGLRPGSAQIQQLEAQLPWPADPSLPRLTCVWSPDDLLMFPPETARVTGAAELCLPGYTHLSFLLKPRAWVMLSELLRGPALRLAAGG